MRKMWIIIVVAIILTGLILGFSTNWFGLKGTEGVKSGYCAVCGMPIIIDKNTPRYEYKGKTYYFMNEDHKKTFMTNPDQFIKK